MNILCSNTTLFMNTEICLSCKFHVLQVFFFFNQFSEVCQLIESAKSFYDQSGYTFPIYFDYQFEGYYAYDLQSIPRTVIINSDFTVSAYYTGMISEQILENAINSAK